MHKFRANQFFFQYCLNCQCKAIAMFYFSTLYGPNVALDYYLYQDKTTFLGNCSVRFCSLTDGLGQQGDRKQIERLKSRFCLFKF